jgi:hypothetical protein
MQVFVVTFVKFDDKSFIPICVCETVDGVASQIQAHAAYRKITIDNVQLEDMILGLQSTDRYGLPVERFAYFVDQFRLIK